MKSQNQTSLECLDREFNMIFHVVKDTFHLPEVTPSQINIAVNNVNNLWSKICVKFNVCDIRYVDNHNFLKWRQDTMEAEFIAQWYEPRTINIIVVDTISIPRNAAGYATLAGIASRGKPIIVIAGMGPLPHELGHYFGLEHTFAGTLGNPSVLANNSNCSTTGDEICDTPPDPYQMTTGHYDKVQCKYTGPIKDITGQFYNPLIENIMSYYSGCTKSFTHQQYEKMVKTYKIDKEAHF